MPTKTVFPNRVLAQLLHTHFPDIGGSHGISSSHALRIPYFLQLPMDVLHHLFSFLPVQVLYNVSVCNREFYKVCAMIVVVCG
jgi:hypothetical protein